MSVDHLVNGRIVFKDGLCRELPLEPVSERLPPEQLDIFVENKQSISALPRNFNQNTVTDHIGYQRGRSIAGGPNDFGYHVHIHNRTRIQVPH